MRFSAIKVVISKIIQDNLVIGMTNERIYTGIS